MSSPLPGSPRPLLEIHGLTVEFPTRHGTQRAVTDVDVTVARGEIVGVVGESGAGKSTIGNAVIDLLEPPGRRAAGEISVEGTRIDNASDDFMREMRGRRIGMIFQDPLTSLNPLMSVEAQLVETILAHLPLDRSGARAKALALLERVGIPDASVRMHQYPHEFSGGMRQRVVIALALCADPDVVIADEPTTALDVSIQAQILELMRELCRERGVGMIVITHDMGVIADVADRVVVMYRGEVVETGPTEKILSRPEHAYTRSLISAIPRPDRKVDRFPLVEYIESAGAARRSIDISNHWLGKHNDDDVVPDEMLRIEHLSVRFLTRRAFLPQARRYTQAVDDVSFEIRAGETFGLVGESGSGKSTVARAIAGLHKVNGGRIVFAGHTLTDIASTKELNHYRRNMQMVFQDPFSSLNPRMRVADIVAEPIRFHRLSSSRPETRQIVGDLLDHVGLGAQAGLRYPHEFSGGQRQRISIARALATRPRFLICDEPTSALDVSIQAQILNLLKDLQRDLGLTMLFISHDLPVIRQMCDRVGVMRYGKMCEIAETETLFESPTHSYTQELLALMPRLSGIAESVN